MNSLKSAMIAGFMILSTGVSADYFLYNDELRKDGQSVEEAKKEQMAEYRERMTRKYKDQDPYANLRDRIQLVIEDEGLSDVVKLDREQEKKNAELYHQKREMREHAEKLFRDHHKEIMGFQKRNKN